MEMPGGTFDSCAHAPPSKDKCAKFCFKKCPHIYRKPNCDYCKQVTGSLLNSKEICEKCIKATYVRWNKVPNDLFIGFAVVTLADADFPERYRDGNLVEDIFISTATKKQVLPEDKKSCLRELEKVVKRLYEINL